MNNPSSDSVSTLPRDNTYHRQEENTRAPGATAPSGSDTNTRCIAEWAVPQPGQEVLVPNTGHGPQQPLLLSQNNFPPQPNNSLHPNNSHQPNT